AVPDPWRATTGSVMWNSATPPLVMPVLVWLAITSTSLAAADSVTRVRGSTPVPVVMSWPRYPTTPGTPDQSSFAVMSPVSFQAWLNGTACGPESARTDATRVGGNTPVSSTT